MRQGKGCCYCWDEWIGNAKAGLRVRGCLLCAGCVGKICCWSQHWFETGCAGWPLSTRNEFGGWPHLFGERQAFHASWANGLQAPTSIGKDGEDVSGAIKSAHWHPATVPTETYILHLKMKGHSHPLTPTNTYNPVLAICLDVPPHVHAQSSRKPLPTISCGNKKMYNILTCPLHGHKQTPLHAYSNYMFLN